MRLADGRTVRADGVVIATVASARRLPGTEHLAGVHVLRTLDDALALRRSPADGGSLVVVGGGFSGGEVASTAHPGAGGDRGRGGADRAGGPARAAHGRRGLRRRLRGPVLRRPRRAVRTEAKGFTVDGSEGLARIPPVGEGRDRRYYAITIKPQVFVDLVPDHVIFHRMYPPAADRTVVECHWLYLPEVMASGAYLDRSVELFDRVNRQDFAACERCQPGMGSRLYARGGALVPANTTSGPCTTGSGRLEHPRGHQPR